MSERPCGFDNMGCLDRVMMFVVSMAAMATALVVVATMVAHRKEARVCEALGLFALPTSPLRISDADTLDRIVCITADTVIVGRSGE